MDHITHLVMAYKLLKTCSCNSGSSIYSVLPALDREPAHFHRVYAHIITNFPRMLTSATHVFCDHWPSDLPVDTTSYEFDRISVDSKYYLDLAKKAAVLANDEGMMHPEPELVGSGLALLSHLYFDTYNNPVQAFLPDSVAPSGQWEFWKKVDYMAFRTKFYSEKALSFFRKAILEDSIWDVKIDPYKMIKAMIIRLGDMSLPSPSYQIVDSKIRTYLDFLKYDKYDRVENELDFCLKLESRIESLINRTLQEA